MLIGELSGDFGEACVDTPVPGDKYTCAQQAAWNKCNEAWMKGYCNKSCNRCPSGGGGSSFVDTFQQVGAMVGTASTMACSLIPSLPICSKPAAPGTPPAGAPPAGAPPAQQAAGNAPGINAARYPADTYYYYKDGMYHVAIPLNSGLGSCCPVVGLGDFGATITHREVPVTVDPAPWGAIPLDQSQVDAKTGKTPWYKKWYILAAIGGGAVVLGGGAYYFTRKPRAAGFGLGRYSRYSRYRW